MDGFTEVQILLLLPFGFGLTLLALPSRFNQFFSILASVLYCAFVGNIAFPAFFGATAEYKFNALASLGWEPIFQLDSVSATFIIATALISLIAFSVSGPWFKEKPKSFSYLSFLLVAACNGAFLSRDMLLFYCFFEAVLIPSAFILGIWGTVGKGTATLRFVLMSLFGSLFMLISMISLGWKVYAATGSFSLDPSQLSKATALLTPQDRDLCFLGFFIAFAIKLPLMPFHSWLPDAYTIAPTPLTIWMSSILSKLGVFGIFRFLIPIFSDVIQAHQEELLLVAALSIVIAGLFALKEKNPKRMLAYSSVSHLGFVALGLFTGIIEAETGAMFLAISHTFSSAGLFLTNEIKTKSDTNSRGLSVFTFVLLLAAVALPGTANFVGEFLVLKSAYSVSPWITGFASTGVIIGAAYMLTYFQNNFFQQLPEKKKTNFAWVALVPCVVILIYLGFQPKSALHALGGQEHGNVASR